MSWSSARPTNLHVSHLWGGGTEAWIEDFAAADGLSENLALHSLGTEECYGLRLRLVHVASGTELDSWTLRHPISEVRSSHPEVAAVLFDICARFDIRHLYVSSLVGLSLDVFRLGIPCTKIYHDYFPFCPAFFITRDGICRSCTEQDLASCATWDTSHRPKGSPAYYRELRSAYFEAVDGAAVRHVSPSQSVPRNLRALDSRWDAIDFDIIGHGITHRKRNLFGGAEEGRRLRVGLLGLLGWNKGRELLRDKFDSVRTIVDLHIIGAEEAGVEYDGRWGASFVHHYEPDALEHIIERRRLDLMIFLSLVPETFSFTLSESWCFCVPPAARSIGAHAERISEGADGFLFGRENDDLIEFLLWADRERGALRQVAKRLRDKPVRTVREAVRDYYRLRPDYAGHLEDCLELTV
ncbi:MAG: hypothetical protein AAF560_01015 [Acidobacteriota bacterium]